mmetsp:Transcript_13942/g.34051  ORF Transcript_13942/g.34051 Transcript_13942/m.34051 type:complete len:451 (-) Transcript_13942:61-1413(-)
MSSGRVEYVHLREEGQQWGSRGDEAVHNGKGNDTKHRPDIDDNKNPLGEDEDLKDNILAWHLPMRYTLALFGMWPMPSILGYRIPRLASYVWSLMVFLTYLTCIPLQIRWWVKGRPTITGAFVWEGRLSEMLYIIKMLFSWSAVFFMARQEGLTLHDMLCDKRLLRRHKNAFAWLYFILVTYLTYTTVMYVYLFAKNFYDPKYKGPNHSYVVIVEYLVNYPFVATILLFAIVCFHVRDTVSGFANGVPWSGKKRTTSSIGVRHIIEDSSNMIPRKTEEHSIQDLIEHFNFVCKKLTVPKRFFGYFINVTHVCVIVRLGIVLLWAYERNRVKETVWQRNALLTARVVLICLLEDVIGSQVVISTRKMQKRIVNWKRPVNKSGENNFDSIREEMRDSFQHLFLQQRSSVLEALNYHSLSVFGIPMTPENIQTFVYLLGLAFFSVYLGHSQKE